MLYDSPDGGVLGESGSLCCALTRPSVAKWRRTFRIMLNSSGAPPPVVRLSQDQKDLTLQFSGTESGANYNVTVSDFGS